MGFNLSIRRLDLELEVVGGSSNRGQAETWNSQKKPLIQNVSKIYLLVLDSKGQSIFENFVQVMYLYLLHGMYRDT